MLGISLDWIWMVSLDWIFVLLFLGLGSVLVRRHYVFSKVLMNAGAFLRIRIRRILLDLDFVRC